MAEHHSCSSTPPQNFPHCNSYLHFNVWKKPLYSNVQPCTPLVNWPKNFQSSEVMLSVAALCDTLQIYSTDEKEGGDWKVVRGRQTDMEGQPKQVCYLLYIVTKEEGNLAVLCFTHSMLLTWFQLIHFQLHSLNFNQRRSSDHEKFCNPNLMTVAASDCSIGPLTRSEKTRMLKYRSHVTAVYKFYLTFGCDSAFSDLIKCSHCGELSQNGKI